MAAMGPDISFSSMVEHILEVMAWNTMFFVTAYSPFERRGQFFISHFLASVKGVTDYFVVGEEAKTKLRTHLRKQISKLNSTWSVLLKEAKAEQCEVNLGGILKEEHHAVLEDLDEYLFGLKGVFHMTKADLIAKQKAAKVRRNGKKGREWIPAPFPPSGRQNTAELGGSATARSRPLNNDKQQKTKQLIVAKPAVGGAGKKKKGKDDINGSEDGGNDNSVSHMGQSLGSSGDLLHNKMMQQGTLSPTDMSGVGDMQGSMSSLGGHLMLPSHQLGTMGVLLEASSQAAAVNSQHSSLHQPMSIPAGMKSSSLLANVPNLSMIQAVDDGLDEDLNIGGHGLAGGSDESDDDSISMPDEYGNDDMEHRSMHHSMKRPCPSEDMADEAHKRRRR